MTIVVRILRGPLVAVAALSLALSGCSTTVSYDSGATAEVSEPSVKTTADDGDDATWVVLDPAAVTTASTSLELAVTRADCASGVTGAALDAVVEYERDRVVIHTRVEKNGPGVHTCQGNDSVDITVELTEAVGDRVLFDAFCLESANESNAACTPEGARWRP